jgi:hypothetical protein
MAALSWHFEEYQLPRVTMNIGEVRRVVKNELQRRGFTDVRMGDTEVAGTKDGVVTSIAFPPIDGANGRFYQVVVGAGDNFGTAQTTVNGMVDAIRKFRFPQPIDDNG